MHFMNIAILLFSVILLKFLHQRFLNKLSAIPGPWYTHYTSIILDYHWLRGNRVRYIHSLHLKYGPIIRLSPTELSFTDPAAVKQIYRAGSGYKKAPWYQNLTANNIRNLFNTSDMAFHAHHRRLLAGPLSETSLKNVESLVEARVNLAVEKMRGEMHERGVVDVFSWWLFMATDVIVELSFGESFRMLEGGVKTQYIYDLQSTAKFGSLRTTFPLCFKLAGYFNLPLFQEAYQAGRRIGIYATQSIQRYRNMVELNPTNHKTTFFTKLFNAKDNSGLSDVDIKNEAQGFIVAGSDTTANTLTYLVWSVCQHPEVKEKLVDELRSLPDKFNNDDLRKLPYLDHIITETLRLYASAPSSLPRIVPPPGATLSNHCIPPGTTVSSQPWSLHRDPTIFTQPESFLPSRWENPTKEMHDAMMPFGAGSRICIGINLARMELRLGAARFFLDFPDARVSMKEGMGEKDMEQDVFFLVSPRGHRCLIEV